MKKRVVFICLGNYCRSPLAEAVFRDLVKKEKLEDKIEVDSRATHRYHIGGIPHLEVRKIMDRENINYDNIYGEQLTYQDGDYFDYILVMDNQIYFDTKNMIAEKNHNKVKLLLSYSDGIDKEIDDPYYTRDFEKSYQEILRGSKALLEKIKKEI